MQSILLEIFVSKNIKFNLWYTEMLKINISEKNEIFMTQYISRLIIRKQKIKIKINKIE